MSVELSPRLLDLLKRYEGFRPQAYQDVAGVWTIGYGHAIWPSERHLRTAKLTPEEAEGLLRQDAAKAAKVVQEAVSAPLRPEQFDALVSLVFNIGGKAFEQSTLLRRLNDGHCCAVPDEIRRWNRAGGKVVGGLVARRDAEAKLFSRGYGS